MAFFGGKGAGGTTYWLWKKRALPTQVPRGKRGKHPMVPTKALIRLKIEGRLGDVQSAHEEWRTSAETRYDGRGRTKRFIEHERTVAAKRRAEADDWIKRVKARKK